MAQPEKKWETAAGAGGGGGGAVSREKAGVTKRGRSQSTLGSRNEENHCTLSSSSPPRPSSSSQPRPSPRQSCKLISISTLGGLLTFSQVSNLSSNKKIDEFFEKNMHLDDCEMPPQGFIAKIARGRREGTKLNLFNFDVIRDTRLGNQYLVIDINYFPG
ncbi:hypothetical protein Droror1_Dr00016343 [Drosera rotundifolia]